MTRRRPTRVASKRLHKGQLALMAGRHEEALREFVWFHHNALKHQPSLYGVRLSFALSYWAELAKVYPKAARALERIRLSKARALREGRGSRETFHDVVAINECVGKESETYRLFVRLNSRRPKLAAGCARQAMPALIQAGDFALARRHLKNPEGRVAYHADILNSDIPKIPERVRKTKTKAPIKEAYIANYCDDVRMLSKVLAGAGERRRARDLRTLAASLIRIPSVRRLIADRLRR